MLKEYGFVRVGAISNKIEVGDVNANVLEIKKCLLDAQDKGIDIVSFPQLSLTGYTCQDLFLTDDLLTNVLKGLEELTNFSETIELTFIVGAPLRINNCLYNCALSISGGKIIGVTPKTYIPNDHETFEYRYFSSATLLNQDYISINGNDVVISNLLVYKCRNNDFLSYAIDIGEDLYVANSISNYTSLLGANLIFHLASDANIINKHDCIKELIRVQSRKTESVYVHAGSSVSESTSSVCYDGYLYICEPAGAQLENNESSFESKMIYTDVDIARVNNMRIRNRCYNQELMLVDNKYTYFKLANHDNSLMKKYDKNPFLLNSDLEEILNIQTLSLAKRIKHLNKPKMIIGISGGSDSTLAFLICLRVKKMLGMKDEDIVAVTMPGFGTSKRTYTNSLDLIKAGKALFKEISIVDVCKQHFKDIGHEENDCDITYENAQARERTQILFDLANDMNGLVIGTGDLSEMILGWATYNGDQMSNYGVNIGIPKTMVLSLIEKVKDESEGELKRVLTDILNTPISPELLPLDSKGNIVQESQNSVGPYKLHDFFIYHFLVEGMSVKKLYYLSCLTFEDEYSKEEIKATLTIFIKRLFSQQFKRSALADGVKIFDISVNAKTDLRLVSDASCKLYLKELESL